MANDGYAVEKFYTDSRDNKGHASSVRVQLPPGFANQLAELIASKRIPEYRTISDVFRDAVVHRLTWLKDEFHVETLERPINMYTIRCEMEALMQVREDSEAAVRLIEDNLRLAASQDELSSTVERARAAEDVAVEPYKSRIHAAVSSNEYRHIY